MFGLFKKKNYTEELLGLLVLQSDVMKEMASLLALLADKAELKQEPEDSVSMFEKICGEWYNENLGLCVSIKKDQNDYYAGIRDIGGSSDDFGISYPIRIHKAMSYFVLDSYAIFIEYKAEIHEIRLCGKLTLLRKAADLSFYPDISFNPN